MKDSQAQPQPDSGRERLLRVAEKLFGERGIQAASIRDIAAAAGIRSATVYHYFGSKDELLWCVWERSGLQQRARVEAAIEDIEAPWERFLAACQAHVEGLLDWGPANQLVFIVPPWQYPAALKDRIVQLRDRYESIFVQLVDDLPLRENVDRHHLRLAVLGALSWPIYWYSKGRGGTPSSFANEVVDMLRVGVGE
ncbi:TetR/AcrR family transcriptional regulator [Alloalcanivorax profundimaris]|nr:TetR/AcrR family transcriptional regulator [Alloalcanivorax profundimaris]